ncbi:MAG: acetyl-CoA carboxylase biotin carboxyl carrier protein [Bdellovibrionales bacterium]|nr:acetyl-CoA carboxylase biotin carboxyl carrier protein [Bdellovibrionales bacterium]
MASSKSASKSGSKKEGSSIAQIEFLMELMNKHRIGDLEWETDDGRVALRSLSAGSVHTAPVAPVAAAAPAAASVAPPAPVAKPAPAAASNQKQITSPFVGTFYRSASPTAQPYVKEGQSIKRGDVLCIIEAMKLMNEIEAEVSGKIVKVLVENGSPVEFGEPLFVIES